MMPKTKDLQVPVLRALVELGGRARASQVYEKVTSYFPLLTDAEQAEQLPSGGSRWTNRIQWARQRLVEASMVSSPEYGMWEVTDAGRAQVVGGPTRGTGASSTTAVEAPPSAPPSIDFVELTESYEDEFKSQVLGILADMTPSAFEEFAGRLLAAYGFVKVHVTGKSGDGGIDGHGQLRVGLAMMDAAFQCKRWRANVGAPEVDAFRGAIQGQFEQGVMLATSGFTRQARGKSIQKGAVPIILLDGPAIVDLMIEKELYVRRRPVYRYEITME